GGCAIRAASIEKPVGNISGRIARRAPSPAAFFSRSATRRWFSATSSQAMSNWTSASFTRSLPRLRGERRGVFLRRGDDGRVFGFLRSQTSPKPIDGFAERFVFFAERETRVSLSLVGPPVERGRRKSGDSDLRREPFAEGRVVAAVEFREPGAAEIRPAGRIHVESDPGE